MELKPIKDAQGRPVCVRCNTRVWEGDIWCESCQELVQREVETISFMPFSVVPSDHE